MDWSFDNSFLFGKKDPTNMHKVTTEATPSPKKNLYGSIKKGTPVETIEVEATDRDTSVFVSLCPLPACGHKTVKCFNETGAKNTIDRHIKVNHRVGK